LALPKRCACPGSNRAGRRSSARGPSADAQAQPTEVLVDDPALLLAVDEREARDLVEVCDRGVLADRELEQQAEALAVLGEQAQAGVHRAARVAALQLNAVDVDRAALAAVCAEDRAQQLAAPGAQQAGDAEDLAGAHLEGDRLFHAGRPEALHLQPHLLADRAVGRRGTATRSCARPSRR